MLLGDINQHNGNQRSSSGMYVSISKGSIGIQGSGFGGVPLHPIISEVWCSLAGVIPAILHCT